MKGMNPTEDPQWIVIDEWCGMWITLAFCRTNLWSGQVNEQKDLIPIIAAFILFRFFDITKLGPIGWAESFHGAVGVMLDDVVAGICALCSLSLLRVLFNF
jgi:phosphatidylglycerophosphatase A